MALQHRLLRRVQTAVGACQVLHRPERHGVDRVRESDAAVDRAIADLPVLQLAEHHRAGAAVAPGAALFGSGAVQIFAQQLEQCAACRHIVQFDNFSAPDEADAWGLHG